MSSTIRYSRVRHSTPQSSSFGSDSARLERHRERESRRARECWEQLERYAGALSRHEKSLWDGGEFQKYRVLANLTQPSLRAAEVEILTAGQSSTNSKLARTER